MRRRAIRAAALVLGAGLAAGAAAQGAGDAARGQVLYEARCGACHSVDEHRVGPAHAGVFGRKAGSAPGYEYSAALRHSAIRWDVATLDRWLANPEATIPGQRMGYRVESPADRADLVAYLRSLPPR